MLWSRILKTKLYSTCVHTHSIILYSNTNMYMGVWKMSGKVLAEKGDSCDTNSSPVGNTKDLNILPTSLPVAVLGSCYGNQLSL